MTKAQLYFDEQMKNNQFKEAYNETSKKVDIEWELERVKRHIINDSAKETVIQEVEKLQEFIKTGIFNGQVNMTQPRA